MSEIVLFHHALGLTDDVRALARDLEAAGHTVHLPDLYEGRTFTTVADGVAHASRELGFATVIERGRAAAEALPPDIVYIGISLGVLPAQMLAQTRPGARAAVFLHGCIAPSEFGSEWPSHVPLQIHMSERDAEMLPPNVDLEAARQLAATQERVELFLYPGEAHLFKDYEEADAALLEQRVLAFLAP